MLYYYVSSQVEWILGPFLVFLAPIKTGYFSFAMSNGSYVQF